MATTNQLSTLVRPKRNQTLNPVPPVVQMTRVQKNVRMMMKMTKSPTPSQVRVLYTHTAARTHTATRTHTAAHTHTTHTTHTHTWGLFDLFISSIPVVRF